HDIAVKRQLSLFPDSATEEAERKNRRKLRQALNTALRRERLPAKQRGVPAVAIHQYLARSHSRLVMVQLEDLAGALEQINVPGTIDQHPNWRRKLPLDLGSLLAAPRAKSILDAVARERPATVSPGEFLSTYRLQLGGRIDFAAAGALLPYLRDLGIS